MKVAYCGECGWHHDGDTNDEVEVSEDRRGSFYVCHLTGKKVYFREMSLKDLEGKSFEYLSAYEFEGLITEKED